MGFQESSEKSWPVLVCCLGVLGLPKLADNLFRIRHRASPFAPHEDHGLSLTHGSVQEEHSRPTFCRATDRVDALLYPPYNVGIWYRQSDLLGGVSASNHTGIANNSISSLNLPSFLANCDTCDWKSASWYGSPYGEPSDVATSKTCRRVARGVTLRRAPSFLSCEGVTPKRSGGDRDEFQCPQISANSGNSLISAGEEK